MKKLKAVLSILALFFSVSLASAKTLPTPTGSGVYVLLDTNYTLGSFKEGNTDVKMYFNNAGSDKITALQFRFKFDTTAFTAPVVTSLNTSWSQYLSYVRKNDYVTVTISYTGSSSTFEIPDGELVNVNFTHKSDFGDLNSQIGEVEWSTGYDFYAAKQDGSDLALSSHSYGAEWDKIQFVFKGNFANVNGTTTKKMAVSIEKTPKGTSSWVLVADTITDTKGIAHFSEILDTTYYAVRMVVRGDTMTSGAAISVADAYKINKLVNEEERPFGYDFYAADVNNDNRINIADVFGVFGRLASRITTWSGAAEVLFFTDAENTSIVSDSANNKRATITGSNTIYYVIPDGDTTETYHVLAPGDANETGFKVARNIPVKITNPNNAANFIIDNEVYYEGLNLRDIEVRLPRLENVEEGNLVNIPLKVVNGSISMGALQYGLFMTPHSYSSRTSLYQRKRHLGCRI